MMWLTRLFAKRTTNRTLVVFAIAAIGLAATAAIAWADAPRPWEFGMQAPATPVKERLSAFHDELLAIITVIALFVFVLLAIVILRFNHRSHPVPTRTSHNTVIEMLWTVIPVLILVMIAIPSFKLMYYMDRVPNPDMTIKVTGHQWYWSYDYPDQGDLSFDSNIIPENELKPGQKRLLDVDNPLVVPVDTVIRVYVTGTDVIPGIYYGQCNQICGVNHAFMPIKVEAVTKDEFQRWLEDAKKKYARHDERGEAVHVAAASDATGVARPAPAGN